MQAKPNVVRFRIYRVTSNEKRANIEKGSTMTESGHTPQLSDTGGGNSAPPKVELADLSAVDGSETLSRVSLTLPAGQITVLMGGSRSGKSLLVRHVLGEIKPDHGRALIAGQSIWDLDDEGRRALHAHIGVLRGGIAIQESEWEESATVLDNICRRLRQGDNADHAQQNAQNYLRVFDLEHVADAVPDELDPAARRRLALALALSADMPLVVIDDPGEGIDVAHLDSIVAGIKRWHARTGATLLVTTHSLDVAKGLAHQVAVLHEGELAAVGPPEQLLGDIHENADFERHFHSSLSVREADPERLKRDQRRLHIFSYLNRSPAQRALIILFVLMIIVLVLLLTGVIPLLPG